MADILVVGAGPTGLMLALWLARLGVAVRVIDKADAPGTSSRALVVHARTLEFEAQLGFAHEATARGLPFDAANLWVQGENVARVVLGDIGRNLTPFPHLLILGQDEHERLLGERLAAAGVEVERSTQLTGFEERDGRIVARLRKAGAEETCECAWLAGCDGARSTVRHALGMEFPGGTYGHLYYVADVQARGPVVNRELNIALDESDLLGVFPLKDPGHVRLVGTVRPSVAGQPHEDIGWDDVSPAILRHLRLEVDRVGWFSTYHVHHRVVPHFRKGRVFLLGDAAHIHSPVGGQGMNTGIGDAVNLGWKLAMVVRGRAQEPLLETYEPERIAFARRLVATTDQGFRFASSDGPLARIVRTQVVPRVFPALMNSEAVRRYAFRTLSQTRIEYRDSALSAGRAAQVHGGDRLPWTGPNFAPLASLEWQAHVYGSANPGLRERCGTLGLALHTMPWDTGAEAAGLAQGALYLVRPDGYVALADADAAPDRLSAYFRDRALSP